MDRNELLKLRAEIVSRTRSLALEGDMSPAEKLDVIMGLISSGDSSLGLLRKAYEFSEQLTDDSSRLDVMLDLIFAIDEELSAKEDVPASSIPEAQPEPEASLSESAQWSSPTSQSN